MIRQALDAFVPYWLGLAWLGLAWLGLAWLGLAWGAIPNRMVLPA